MKIYTIFIIHMIQLKLEICIIFIERKVRHRMKIHI
ncbi:hypothetical protein PFFCH_04116 [Plasmodium falciparum FCH/4]|uniref:Uncharacterized protein n=1 Tax=Plasmodium falciparum FCH/4 TaxID=1036724 RepID=A0A024VJW9_PLAFA|nr:hypothetical protein PFFCH_04116 [Plasmodium falciparum FCH/4]